MTFQPGFDRFDPSSPQWMILGGKACADIPVGTVGTAYDPWQIAGETSDPPTGGNDEGAEDYGTFAATAADEKLTKTDHQLSDGMQVGVYDVGGGLPTGLSSSVPYWVMNATADDLELCATADLAGPVNITADGNVGVRVALSDYFDTADTATERGHVWPFMSLSGTTRSVGQSLPSAISNGGYYPACHDKEGINHYREFVRLAPRMFGSCGRVLWIPVHGVLKATNARDCLDIILHHDLTTSINATTGAHTTTLTAGKYTGFRWVLGNLGANEVAFSLNIVGHAMGPHKQVWHAHLVVAAQTNPESTAPAIDAKRGPALIDLSGTGPDMDTTGSRLALLFAARGTTATSYNTLGAAGSAAQDGSEVYVKVGSALALLSPGV